MSERDPEDKGFTVIDRRGVADETAALRPPPEAETPRPAARVDFPMLVQSIAFSALHYLGLMTEAEGGNSAERDLPLARHNIEILELLEEKTRGNLSRRGGEADREPPLRSPDALRRGHQVAGRLSRSVWWLAPAKLNLGLRVVGRRDDGYHLLESLFVPLDLADRVRVEVEARSPRTTVSMTLVGRAADVPAGDDNLVVRAARAFLEAAGVSARVALAPRQADSRRGWARRRVERRGGGASSARASTLRTRSPSRPWPGSRSGSARTFRSSWIRAQPGSPGSASRSKRFRARSRLSTCCS